MTHLRRAVALILVLLAAFLFIRGQLTPTSFGAYGYYRADNVSDWMALPAQFVGSNTCAACHQERYQIWSASAHKSVNCETCHGAATQHVQKAAQMVVNPSKELCASCHTALASRPKDFPQVNIEEHSRGTACITCHNPHNPSLSKAPVAPQSVSPAPAAPAASSSSPSPTVRSGPPLIPHSLEGRSDCLACHNAQGIVPYPASHAGRTNEICQGCHKSG
ncbi:MAG: hypothetical protein HYX89_07510 [Chloroflexi bacterium]|nr:hypothetical protein [Chloroflexota bacterium]